MAIVHMTGDPKQIPADAVNVVDVTERYRPQVTDHPDFKMWTYQTHVGLCLEEHERNGYQDSDWDMMVWNPAKGEPEWVQGFASTRGWCAPCFGSSVDATPEVRAAYNEWKRKRDEAGRKLYQERMDAMPTKGRMLRVVKGRKVPVGTVGRCFWSDTRFKTDKVLGILFLGYEGRVGIETPTGRQFTDVGNVEVIK